MTPAQEGHYIRLLSICWREGAIPADPAECGKLLRFSSDADRDEWLKGGSVVVQSMFQISRADSAKLLHARLEIERKKQRGWKAKSAKGGVSSGVARRNKSKGGSEMVHTKHEPNGNSSSSSSFSSSTSVETLSSERVLGGDAPTPEAGEEPEKPSGIRSVEAIRPSWPELKAKAEIIGLPEWRAREWFDEMESVGWVDGKGREIVNAWHYLNRVFDWWRKDGAKMTSDGVKRQEISPNVKALLAKDELKRCDDAIRKIDTSYDSHIDMSAKDCERRKKLLKRRSELKATLGFEA